MRLSRSLRSRAVARARRIPVRWRRIVAERIHPALRASLIRATEPRKPSLGTISVIIPCYNVERYLANCLTSVIHQTYPHLQIIVVIDGSPDRSAAIAREFARWDRRIRVVERTNGGLGAARNTGVARATGQYIAFVDSDDDLPPRAYENMIKSLDRSGSDFAVGSLYRHENGRRWVPGWAQEVHRADRIGTTLEEFPEVLPNVFAWDKLFRREFFNNSVKEFPESIQYEDQEPAAKAYVEARAFDVLSVPVYTWYVRSDGTSITQQKAELKNLQDRLEVKRRVHSILLAGASPQVVRRWRAKAIGFDLRSYYEQVPRTEEKYWSVLREGLSEISRFVPEEDWRLVPLHDRILARMTLGERRDALCSMQTRRAEIGDAYLTDDDFLAHPLYLDRSEFQLSREDRYLSADDLRLQAGLLDFKWVKPNLARVTTYAFITGLAPSISHGLRVSWEKVTGAGFANCENQPAVITSTAARVSRTAVDDTRASAALSYADSGLEIDVGMNDLTCGNQECVAQHSWQLRLDLGVGDRWFSSVLTRIDHRGSGGSLRTGVGEDGLTARPNFTVQHGLILHIRRKKVILKSLERTDNYVRLGLESVGDLQLVEVQARCRILDRTVRGPVVAVSTRADAPYQAELRLPAVPSGWPNTRGLAWILRAVDANGVKHQIPWPFAKGSLEPHPAKGELRPVISRKGNMALVQQRVAASVTGFSVDFGALTLTVTGWARLAPHGSLRPALVTTGATEIWEAQSVEHNSTTYEFKAIFSLSHSEWGDDNLIRKPGGRSFRLLGAASTGAPHYWVPVSASATHKLPDVHRGERAAVRFGATRKARALWVVVGPGIAASESGRAKQFALHKEIKSIRRRPLRETVLFTSFAGRMANDSPLAIYNELLARNFNGDLVWAVTDGGVSLPTGAQSVLVHSRQYFELLHTSRFLVNNSNFPFYFSKRAGQTYLQTWHGTPLKRIGRDVPSANLSLSYRTLMDKEVREWDLLLAQNNFSGRTLPQAFGYDGLTLTLGYPRNDLLSTADPFLSATVRQRLGVSPSARVILYAPTFRDNVRSGRGYGMVNYLPLREAAKRLGPDTALLVRGHSNTPGLRQSKQSANILDVSRYPDVTELMLVADVLITDYSSVMFDFASTERPIIYLVPDIRQYADTTRGFYFDFESEAPGPLCSTAAEVFDALDSIECVKQDYATRRADFRNRFASLDDGRASERVVDCIWGQEPYFKTSLATERSFAR